MLALLADRADNATICPSEVARRLARDNPRGWRAQMPIVHEAVDHLVAQAVIALSWKGRRLARRCGPYRIRRERAMA
ncbi:DUF3253 domain-containing protein [Sphingomonas crocodyli]|uniref:DUF3253 domain-containing protein n=1 Tax=Sphingomonas crocodyli TaxID=1979270 RepID=A0A437LYS1_9SPHN|nr:DUF3253 domain-containing protein [Sphingomonas crocodyli]